VSNYDEGERRGAFWVVNFHWMRAPESPLGKSHPIVIDARSLVMDENNIAAAEIWIRLS
jgi:hypothetical protein